MMECPCCGSIVEEELISATYSPVVYWDEPWIDDGINGLSIWCKMFGDDKNSSHDE
jgi:hypothetical protein